jgi:hypothetical protein
MRVDRRAEVDTAQAVNLHDRSFTFKVGDLAATTWVLYRNGTLDHVAEFPRRSAVDLDRKIIFNAV